MFISLTRVKQNDSTLIGSESSASNSLRASAHEEGLFVHFFDPRQRNEPKKTRKGARPLDSLRPARSEHRRRAGAQWSEQKATPFGRSDPKGCVGDADTAWVF